MSGAENNPTVDSQYISFSDHLYEEEDVLLESAGREADITSDVTGITILLKPSGPLGCRKLINIDKSFLLSDVEKAPDQSYWGRKYVNVLLKYRDVFKHFFESNNRKVSHCLAYLSCAKSIDYKRKKKN